MADVAFDEMKRWVGFGPSDEQHLTRLHDVAAPHIPTMIDHFYEKVLESPGASQVLNDPKQVERLKRTLRVWLAELLTGPWDDAYGERRERIGHRHVDVGLHSRYMFTAMSVVTQDLCALAHQHVAPPDLPATCDAIARITSLDLALMTGTYVESRERQQLAALQELLVENLLVTVLVVGTDGRVDACTRVSNLFRGGAVLGRPWVDVVPAELLEASGLEATVERALHTGRQITLVRVDVADGAATRSYRIHVIPLEHPLARFLMQFEELTEAVALEGRLRRSEALAQLGALSAAVAHELRNPLAGISGAVQVMAANMGDDVPYKPIMRKVEQEIGRLDRLVTDLMAFARPAGVRLEALHLEEQARHVVDLVQGDHGAAELEVVGTGRARGDAHLVQQILLNLVQNALQAGGDRTRVQIVAADGRITVCDDGPGIPEALRDQIFEAFFTTKTRGTGLGLAISRRNAQAMQGELELGSSPLGGAAFVLRLPEPL